MTQIINKHFPSVAALLSGVEQPEMPSNSDEFISEVGLSKELTEDEIDALIRLEQTKMLAQASKIEKLLLDLPNLSTSISSLSSKEKQDVLKDVPVEEFMACKDVQVTSKESFEQSYQDALQRSYRETLHKSRCIDLSLVSFFISDLPDFESHKLDFSKIDIKKFKLLTIPTVEE